MHAHVFFVLFCKRRCADTQLVLLSFLSCSFSLVSDIDNILTCRCPYLPFSFRANGAGRSPCLLCSRRRRLSALRKLRMPAREHNSAVRPKGQDTTDATMRVYAHQTHPDARRARHNYFFLRCSVARSYARDAP